METIIPKHVTDKTKLDEKRKQYHKTYFRAFKDIISPTFIWFVFIIYQLGYATKLD